MAASHMRPSMFPRAGRPSPAGHLRALTEFLVLALATASSLKISAKIPLPPSTFRSTLSSRNADQIEWGMRMRGGRQRLSLRGGLDNFVIDELDPLKHVTTLAQAEEAIKHVKLFEDQVDGDLLAGDMFRMNHGWKVGMDEYEQLQENFADTSVQFHLTQQFLILQNERIKSLLPGGSNCTYADSWMTGQLWDRADDEFRWTRSAWTQAKRARTWEEMPAVWKKIMTQQWVEFQEFLAMLALPDAGVGSERYKEHVKAWEMMQTGYMSNLEKTMAEYHDGGKIRDEVERDGEEAKKLYDFRSSEPRVNTLWEWATNKLQHIARMVSTVKSLNKPPPP